MGIYSKVMKTEYLRDICTCMFIAALFTIAKIWKLLVSNRWMYKEDTYMERYSARRKKKILTFATTWMKLDSVILSETWKTEETHSAWYHLHAKSKIWHKWTCLWNRLTENRLMVTKREGRGEWIKSLGLADANYYI